jgi:hypothetical protein
VANAGLINWVVTESGDLLVVPHSVGREALEQDVVSKGQSVLAAGEARIAVGGESAYLIQISSLSSHSLTDQQSLEIGQHAFQRDLGITFASVEDFSAHAKENDGPNRSSHNGGNRNNDDKNQELNVGSGSGGDNGGNGGGRDIAYDGYGSDSDKKDEQEHNQSQDHSDPFSSEILGPHEGSRPQSPDTPRSPSDIRSRKYTEEEIPKLWQEYEQNKKTLTAGEKAAKHHGWPPPPEGYHYKSNGTQPGIQPETREPAQPTLSRNPEQGGHNTDQALDYNKGKGSFTNKNGREKVHYEIEGGKIKEINYPDPDEYRLYTDANDGGRKKIDHIKKQIDTYLKERTELINERDSLQESFKNATSLDQDQIKENEEAVKNLKNGIERASWLIGEKTAEYYAQTRGLTKLFPPAEAEDWSSKRDEFDQIWEGGEKIVVLEAKGNNTQNSTRIINGKDYEQGTPEYCNDVINNMIDKAEDKGYDKKVLEKVYSTFDTNLNNFEYTQVRAVIATNDEGKSYIQHVELTPFKLENLERNQAKTKD